MILVGVHVRIGATGHAEMLGGHPRCRSQDRVCIVERNGGARQIVEKAQSRGEGKRIRQRRSELRLFSSVDQQQVPPHAPRERTHA